MGYSVLIDNMQDQQRHVKTAKCKVNYTHMRAHRLINEFGIDFTPKELDELFQSMDADHSGSVSIGELRAYFQVRFTRVHACATQ